MKNAAAIAADFDAIAIVERDTPNLNALSSAEKFIVNQIPATASTLLDVGCGTGRITRAAARRGLRCTGIDISPRMIEVARANSPDDIEYTTTDVVCDVVPSAPFDVVVTVNVVHHLPLNVIVPRLAALVAPHGTLLIQDVVTRRGLRYLPTNIIAAFASLRRPLSRNRKLRALYDQHGADEVYLTPAQAAEGYGRLLPESRVVHHLGWRYSVIWTRTQGAFN